MRPEREECVSFYWTYVDKVPEGEILDILEQVHQGTRELLDGLPAAKETFAYAEGKWTIRELLGHMIDSERVFGFRALWFARGVASELPGMDQDEFAAVSKAGEVPVADLLAELGHVRASHIAMLKGLDAEAWMRRGVASGCEFTVRALATIMAGHELHHQQVLRDRYLAAGV